jgi:hypothetical protein
MDKSDKLIFILKEMTNLLSSVEDEEIRLPVIRNLYNRSKEANDEELSVIGREILQLCRGGMGSFFDEGLVDGKGDYLFRKLTAELFDAAVEVIR